MGSYTISAVMDAFTSLLGIIIYSIEEMLGGLGVRMPGPVASAGT
jgi:hypothetical protein